MAQIVSAQTLIFRSFEDCAGEVKELTALSEKAVPQLIATERGNIVNEAEVCTRPMAARHNRLANIYAYAFANTWLSIGTD
jgi:hypothetical protein